MKRLGELHLLQLYQYVEYEIACFSQGTVCTNE